MSVRGIAVTLTAASVAAGVLLSAAPAAHAADTITVWADAAHAPVIEQLLPKGYAGVPVTVVTKDPGTVRAELAGRRAAHAWREGCGRDRLGARGGGRRGDDGCEGLRHLRCGRSSEQVVRGAFPSFAFTLDSSHPHEGSVARPA